LKPGIELHQDEDVLETWFSSALWTFATLGWPERTPELKRYHPTDVLVTGHDIIFFWVARMIMMTLKFMGEVPFRKVYIHGLVRDADGKKMSKSQGNGLDPLDLIDGIDLEALVAKRTGNLLQPQMAATIEKATRRDFPEGIPSYGTDALRFTYCALASTGRDLRFDLKRIEGYRNFCNKLWNATKFVLMNTEGESLEGDTEKTLADRWIASRAHAMLRDAERAIETYRFDIYANVIYEFVWREYCDWYLELTKPLLWDDDTDENVRRGTRHSLLAILELLLRAAHPIIPFITETLWKKVAPLIRNDGPTIMLQPFPEAADLSPDPEADAAIEWLKSVVVGIRNIRGELNIKPGQNVPLLLQGGDDSDRARFAATRQLLERLAKIEDFQWLDVAEQAPPAAVQLVGDLKVMVPLAGLVDAEAERVRLDKEIGRLTKELARLQGKLGNEKFIENAPGEVVDKERLKARDADASLATLRGQREQLEGI
jgi:valyl-tRNA synthetase